MKDNIYNDPRIFGNFMFKLRNLYGWSRKYIAEKIGFRSESSIMNFETGHTFMKAKHIHQFCNLTPNNLTVPVLFAMFEARSLKPPCKCVCHYDMSRAIPNIYMGSECRLCGHKEGECELINGLWFESGEENFIVED